MQEEVSELDQGHSVSGGGTVSRRGPKSALLPPEASILKEARILAADRNVRIGNLATLIVQDPVITLEVLRVANATLFAGDRPSITTAQTALIRLGSQTVVDLLDRLKARPVLTEPEVFREFENLRALARRASVISLNIAREMRRDISEIAQTAGLLTYTGHMIACVYLAEDYVELLQGRKRNTAAYRIQQEHNFDLNTVALEYLRAQGVPNEVFFALDRELKCKTPSQSDLRFLVQSAVELVEAFEAGRWEKYSPGAALPSKSALRLLKLSEEKYRTIYEATDNYLRGKADKEQEENDERQTAEASSPACEVEQPLPAPQLQDTRQVTIKRDGFNRPEDNSPTLILTRNGFGYDAAATPTNFIEPDNDETESEKNSLTPEAQQVLNLIGQLCADSKTTQELLLRLLRILISEGPFVRAALIRLQSHRQSADTHMAVGEGFSGDSSIDVNDPLSPLALCLTKIKSFNAKDISDLLSPFGISSYAVSPIRLNHSEPIVLYADCGLNRPLPLEARKIFRLVVGLLNHTLPRLPGGLPRTGNADASTSATVALPET